MEKYRIELKRSAAKEIENVRPMKRRRQIVTRIEILAYDPRPPGCQKLSGQDAYRIRHGAYRIIYTIEDDRQIVTVMKVGHRRDVYRAG